MKKTSTLLIGLFFTSAAFAGGFGIITPIKLENAPVAKIEIKKVVNPRVITRTLRHSNCGYSRQSRWYECDTKSVLQNRLNLRHERISGDLIPTLRNRGTRGQDIEREFDRQAAARNKLLRYRRAFNR